MLMLVCFRCIQVSTYEENHRCLASPDSDDTKETENVLLIDYESVNLKHDFILLNGEAYKQRSCGDFDHLSECIQERMNIDTSLIPTVKQASVSNFDLLKRSRSIFKNNRVSHSEKYKKVDQITVNKCEQKDIITRSLPIKDSLNSEKSYKDFKQLAQLFNVNEVPKQDNDSFQPQPQVADKANASAIFKNNYVFHSETYKKADQITFNKCNQNDIITRSLPIIDSLKSEKSSRDFKQLDQLVSANEAPQHDNHSLQPQPQVADRGNASAALLNQLPSSTTKKVFRCEKCTLVMETELLFNLHVNNDCDQKPFKCDQCSMKFYLSDSLVVHQLVHTKEQGFKCKFCTYSTKTKRNMKRHVCRVRELNNSCFKM